MSMISVPGNEQVTFTDVTENSFTEITYYYTKECDNWTSKFQGKYRKVTKYSLEIKDYPMFLIITGIPKGVPIPDYILSDFVKYGYYDTGIHTFKANVEVLSEKIELNPDYDLNYYQKEYEAASKDLAEIEKETGLNVWIM